MTLYFGRLWDAPAFDDATEIPTPTGEDCGWCDEPIGPDDSGTMMSFPDGLRPAHIECWLRSALGDVYHLRGECSCSGGDGHDERPYREASRASVQWMIEHRRGRFVDGGPL